MSDTRLGFQVGPTDVGHAGVISGRSDWLEPGLSPAGLVPALEESLTISLGVLLSRIHESFQTLQTLTDGAAFPGWDSTTPVIEVFPLIDPNADILPAPLTFPGGPNRTLARISLPTGELRIVGGDFQLIEGSVWTKLKYFLTGATSSAALLMVLQTPVENLQRDIAISLHIHRQIEGSECYARSEVTFLIWPLRYQAAAALDFHNPDLSADEKRAAICSLQLMLLRAGFNPGPIDGIYGEDTREQHELFAAQFGFDVTDSRVAENLINAMHPNED